MKCLRIIAVMIMLTASFLTLAACQKLASPLEDYTWVLIQYGAPGKINTALPDTAVTAFFDSKEKQVSGNGGCNAYGGSHETDRLPLPTTGPRAPRAMG